MNAILLVISYHRSNSYYRLTLRTTANYIHGLFWHKWTRITPKSDNTKLVHFACTFISKLCTKHYYYGSRWMTLHQVISLRAVCTTRRYSVRERSENRKRWRKKRVCAQTSGRTFGPSWHVRKRNKSTAAPPPGSQVCKYHSVLEYFMFNNADQSLFFVLNLISRYFCWYPIINLNAVSFSYRLTPVAVEINISLPKVRVQHPVASQLCLPFTLF